MKRTESYHPWALLTVVFWSLGFVLTRLAIQYFAPYALGFLRYFVASLCLLAVVLIRKIPFPDKKQLPLLAVSGAVGFFLYMAALNTGSRTVNAATSCTVIATVPVFTALLARFIYRESLTFLQWASILVAFSGVAALTILAGGLSANAGLIYIFAAAVLLSVYNLLQRKLTKTSPPLQVVAYSVFFGTLMLSVFSPQAVRQLAHAPAVPLLCVLLLGVFPGAIAYASWAKAFSLAKKTSSVSNYMFVEPFLTAVFGYVLAGEKLSAATLVGGAVIMAGLFLFYFGDRLLRRRAADSGDNR